MKTLITNHAIVRNNWHFELVTEGFNGYFFITFEENAKGPEQDKELIAVAATYENATYPASYRVEDVTDAMLFVERKKQWILEELQRLSK